MSLMRSVAAVLVAIKFSLFGNDESYMERLFNLKLSGDEVYYAESSAQETLKNSYSKVHCQPVFI